MKKKLNVLFLGDNDLIGNKFNGHDLHIYLREQGVIANHLVTNKLSSDPNTYIFPRTTPSQFTKKLLSQNVFLDADVIHLHLIHNTFFDLNYLPLISSLKPIVWTIHDPWVLGGHCVYHGECDKWRTHCADCGRLDAHFSLQRDTSALEFATKKRAIQNSQLFPIVASQWMEDKLADSPIWAGKRIQRIPFGVNQSLFVPGDKLAARKELGIAPEGTVLFCRLATTLKGIDLIRDALAQAGKLQEVTVLTVGFAEKELLFGLPNSVRHIHYGWLTDDHALLRLYQACDVFLMPSEQEAFGMMAIEAMSCGKVVLVQEASGSALPQVVNAPDCGIAASRDTYASELCRLLKTPSEIRQRGERSLAFARRFYNLEDYLSNIIDAYDFAQENFTLDADAPLILTQLRKYACDKAQKNTESLGSKETATSVVSQHGDMQSWRIRLKNYYYNYGLRRTVLKIMEKAQKRIRRI